MATLRDVAKAAGVSVTTASLVINGKGEERHIAAQTIERVLQCVKDLDYRANISARSLRSSEPPRPKLTLFWPLDNRTSILGYRINNIVKALSQAEYDCELSMQLYRSGRLARCAAPLLKGTCDGAIVGATTTGDLEFLDSVTPVIPVMLLNSYSNRYNTVGVNNHQMGLQAATLIYQKGYRDVAALIPETPHCGTGERARAFLDSCQRLGVHVRHENRFYAPGGLAGGAAAARQYVSAPGRPHMLFCVDDGMAQGALTVLHHSGLLIPQDLELLAFSRKDAAATEYLVPSLSCVSVPAQVDERAVEILVEKMRNHDLSPTHLQLEPQLQLRDSFRL